ncbi:MAG TPA: peptidylprolyl isomerase [Lacipirellulaceae bacterium]|nr:peptidylprolyl isomerase [Lacipirellulaceae bacterium]
MLRKLHVLVLVISSLAITVTTSRAEEKTARAPAEPPKTLASAQTKASPPPPDAAHARAVFETKFDDYKAALRGIEKLQTEYQTADASEREKINQSMVARVTQAQSLVDAMVAAAEDVYRASPNTDPHITGLLSDVAEYETIGRQIGRGIPSPRNPDDVYYPIDGGDQYEKALPIIKLLIDGGAKDKELYVWGFLCAFATNDYDLAKTYLAQVKATGALQPIADAAARGERADSQAGLMKTVLQTMSGFFSNLDEYRELWANESKIRADEAKANDLPRVKLTTTKGDITLELFENQAPQTVANFVTLVKQGFYNGSPFHRVLPEFMAQAGAKTDEGNGGPGYNIRDEMDRPDFRRHFRGSVSMANTGEPNSADSQFFINFIPTPHLNGRHTVFGRVIGGMDVLAKLQHRSPSHEMNPPKPDRILKAEVIRERPHPYKFDKIKGE